VYVQEVPRLFTGQANLNCLLVHIPADFGASM